MSVSQKLGRGMKISTALVLLGIVAGTFLGQWLPDFGGGGGEGLMPARSTDAKTPPETEKETEEPPPEDAPTVNGNVLQITIRGRGYWLKATEVEPEQEITLKQAVSLATTARGDENGIRVHVTRDDTARAKTEDELEKALLQAELPPQSIVGLEDTPP